jgi:hypothetical protein
MKKLNQKLSLKKETLASLDKQQMNGVKGGLLSIGHNCSHNNDCPRTNKPTKHCVSNHHCN